MAGAEATPLLDTGSKGGDPSKDPSSKPAANTKYDTTETSSCCAQRSPWHALLSDGSQSAVVGARCLATAPCGSGCSQARCHPWRPPVPWCAACKQPSARGQQWCRLAFVRCIQSSSIINYHSIGYKRCYHRLCGACLLDAVGHNLAHSLTCRPHTQLCARQEQTNNSDIDEILCVQASAAHVAPPSSASVPSCHRRSCCVLALACVQGLRCRP